MVGVQIISMAGATVVYGRTVQRSPVKGRGGSHLGLSGARVRHADAGVDVGGLIRGSLANASDYTEK